MKKKKKMYDQNIDEDEYYNNTYETQHVNVFDLSDILKSMFTDEKEFVSDKSTHTKKPQTQRILVLSLDDVVFGCTKKVKYEQTLKCEKCDVNGLSHTGLMHCLSCNGQGFVESFPLPSICRSCNGESVIRQNLHKCKDCDGGFNLQIHEINVKLESGISHNKMINVNDELVVTVKHGFISKEMKVKNNDIHLIKTIKIEEAILGFKYEIKLTDTESVIKLKSDKYIDTTQPWIIQNRGVLFNKNERGNLVIKFIIQGSSYSNNIIKFRKAFEKIFA